MKAVTARYGVLILWGGCGGSEACVRSPWGLQQPGHERLFQTMEKERKERKREGGRGGRKGWKETKGGEERRGKVGREATRREVAKAFTQHNLSFFAFLLLWMTFLIFKIYCCLHQEVAAVFSFVFHTFINFDLVLSTYWETVTPPIPYTYLKTTWIYLHRLLLAFPFHSWSLKISWKLIVITAHNFSLSTLFHLMQWALPMLP